MSSERAEVVVFQYPAQIVTQTLVSHQVEPYICHSLSKWLTRWLPVGYLRFKLCILRRFLPEKRQITTNQRGVWMFVPKLFYVMCIKTTSLIWSDNNPHHGPCPRVLFCALIGHFDCPRFSYTRSSRPDTSCRVSSSHVISSKILEWSTLSATHSCQKNKNCIYYCGATGATFQEVSRSQKNHGISLPSVARCEHDSCCKYKVFDSQKYGQCLILWCVYIYMCIHMHIYNIWRL